MSFPATRVLLDVWHQLSQKIQLCFVMSQVIVRRSDFIGTSDSYIEAALGDDLERMHQEIDRHLQSASSPCSG